MKTVAKKPLAEIIPAYKFENPMLSIRRIQEAIKTALFGGKKSRLREIQGVRFACYLQWRCFYGRWSYDFDIVVAVLIQKATGKWREIASVCLTGRGKNEYAAWVKLFREHFLEEDKLYARCQCHELVRVESPLNHTDCDSGYSSQGFRVKQCRDCGMLYGTRYQSDAALGDDDITYPLDHDEPSRFH